MVLAEAQAAIARASIDEARQRIWSEEIVRRLPSIIEADLRAAVRKIAMTTHDQWWRLELGELVAEARKARLARVARETQSIGAERQLSARTQTPDELAESARACRSLVGDFIAGKISGADLEREMERTFGPAAGKARKVTR